MPITPDDIPNIPDDEPSARSRNRARNGSAGNGAASAQMANAESDGAENGLDDAGDIDTADGEELEEAATGFTDMVRQSPIGALVGAFIAGFLVARLI